MKLHHCSPPSPLNCKNVCLVFAWEETWAKKVWGGNFGQEGTVVDFIVWEFHRLKGQAIWDKLPQAVAAYLRLFGLWALASCGTAKLCHALIQPMPNPKLFCFLLHLWHHKLGWLRINFQHFVPIRTTHYQEQKLQESRRTWYSSSNSFMASTGWKKQDFSPAGTLMVYSLSIPNTNVKRQHKTPTTDGSADMSLDTCMILDDFVRDLMIKKKFVGSARTSSRQKQTRKLMCSFCLRRTRNEACEEWKAEWKCTTTDHRSRRPKRAIEVQIMPVNVKWP